MILDRRPVNRTAALVVSSSSVVHDYSIKANSTDFPFPLPTRSPTRRDTENPRWEDLSDRKFGRLQVLGMSANKPKRWVCRCDCGMYTLRTRAALKTAATPCDQCYSAARAKAQEFYRRTGRRREIEQFL